MSLYILKRSIKLLITLVVICFLIFSLIHLQPGNPYYNSLRPGMSEQDIQKYLTEKGYYDPFFIKFFKWAKDAIKFDFGYSIQHKSKVINLIMDRIPYTLYITVPAFFLSMFLSLLLGIFWASTRNRIINNLFEVTNILISSLPTFILALFLLKYLAFDIKLFPLSGMGKNFWDNVHHLFLPIITLTIIQTAPLTRYVKNFLCAELDKNHIKTAQMKGLTLRQAIFKNGLTANKSLIITLFFMEIPSIFSGALVTETFFVLPGIGKLNYDAVVNKDYPLILGILFFVSIIVLITNFLSDIVNECLDPRIRCKL